MHKKEKGIIDVHTHLFPPEIYKNWVHYAKKDAWFEKLTKTPVSGKGVLEAWADEKETLACMDAAGVEKIIMQGWYFNDLGMIRMHNDYMAELIKTHPDRMFGFMAINPKHGTQALYEIERCQALGFIGIGELGPGGNGYDFTDPDFLQVIEAADQMKLPVCIHCGEAVSHDYPGKDQTPLGPLAEVILKHPDLKFLLAHLGGGMPFFEMGRRYQCKFNNVYYDTAALPLLYHISSIQKVMQLVGDHKLLFGSDFPLTLYPSKLREMDMQLLLEDILNNSGLNETQLNALLWDNARALTAGS